jgi:hypothetical protein
MRGRELEQLGQDIANQIARKLASGGRTAHLQLLASRFFEALKEELKQTPRHNDRRIALLTSAADRCRNVASCTSAPSLILVHVQAAVALLSEAPAVAMAQPSTSTNPQLRLIQGGAGDKAGADAISQPGASSSQPFRTQPSSARSHASRSRAGRTLPGRAYLRLVR